MRTKKKKILLVDGSPASVLLERMILGTDYDLRVADDEDPLRAAEAVQPDLILMDVDLPGASGLEALRRVRRDAAMRDVPVILVTARGEAAVVEEGWRAGCSEYCTKPVDAEELLAKVGSCLE